jgi:hypothetical protein
MSPSPCVRLYSTLLTEEADCNTHMLLIRQIFIVHSVINTVIIIRCQPVVISECMIDGMDYNLSGNYLYHQYR